MVYEAAKDSNLLQQSFFVIFTGRLILFYIIIASLMYSPLIQAVLIFVMSVLMVLYLFIQSPIKDKLRLVQQVSQELILLVINTCLLVIAALDRYAKS